MIQWEYVGTWNWHHLNILKSLDGIWNNEWCDNETLMACYFKQLRNDGRRNIVADAKLSYLTKILVWDW